MFLKKSSFFLFCFVFTSCFVSQKQVAHYSPAVIKIDTSIAKQKEMEVFLAPYRFNMDSAMDKVMGISAVPLSKAQPECTMGNFIADAQLAIAKKQNSKTIVSVMNYGGMRIPYLSPGNITKGNIYEMMPFDSKLTLIEIPGSVLIQFCNHIAKYRGWPVSGISFQIKDKKAVRILVAGQPINEHFVYLTAVSDYLANGGDQCDFLIPCKKVTKNIFIRDLLMEYLTDLTEKGEQLHPKIENRVTYAE